MLLSLRGRGVKAAKLAVGDGSLGLRTAVRADWIAAMRTKMAQPEQRVRFRLRRQTMEPVFGIVKKAIGFRQFLLRGFEKVQGE